jgi:plastocyanin
MRRHIPRLSGMLLPLGGLLLSGTAHAADITVLVKDENGRPVADAVVILDGPAPSAPRPGHFLISQKDMKFVPFVLVVSVGSTVDFGNLDPFRHHVYSFSPAKKFELKLFARGETRPVRFDKVGVVAIGCNIHDSMQAFVQVVGTPFAAKTGANGRVILRGVPDAMQKLRIWHPQLRAPANQVSVAVNAKSNVSLPVTIKLRRPAPMSHDY